MLTLVPAAYLAPGILFGVWFFLRGHARIDASSVDAAWFTRLLWLPASILLWPLLATKLSRRTGEE